MVATMTDDSISKKWRMALKSGELGSQVADPFHPLEIFYGVDDSGRARAQVRSAEQPKEPIFSDIVSVVIAEVSGSWRLTLTLMEPTFEEEFIGLVADVVKRTKDEDDQTQALTRMNDVFNHWRRLLTPNPPARLGLEALRGLVGELWFLRHRVAQEVTLLDALECWVGPFRAPQDFVFESTVPREVKSVGPTAPRIKISSAEQLDVEEMELVVIELPQVPVDTACALSMVTEIESLRSEMDAAGLLPSLLDARLRALGVDLGDDWYSQQWFLPKTKSVFVVTEMFPAIRASELPRGATRVNYELERSAIEEFKIQHELLEGDS